MVRAHIDDAVVTLVLNRAGGIDFFQCIISMHKVFAGAGFVPERPDHNRSVVLILMEHLHDATNVGILPLGRVRERSIAVIILVRLDVGLVFQIEAVFVGQVIPIFIRRVMCITHVVNVATLHEHHLCFHLLTSQHVACFRMCLVAVDALELHWLAVYVVITTGQTELVVLCQRVFDRHFAEANMSRDRLDHLAGGIFQLRHNGVAIRALGRPLVRMAHLHDGFRCHFTTTGERRDRSLGADAFHRLILVRVKFVRKQRVVHAIPLRRLTT